MRKSLVLLPVFLFAACASGTSGGGDAGTNDAGPSDKDRANSDLAKFASAYQRFHADTGQWPDGSVTWNVNSDGCFAPESMDSSYDALFKAPQGTTACASGTTQANHCWKGPYLPGDPNIAFGVGDPWGNPYKVFLIANSGSSNACPQWSAKTPNGAIVLYSTGSDGTDNSQGNMADLAEGTVSGDDIALQVTSDVR